MPFSIGVFALLIYLAPGALLPGNDTRPLMYIPHALLLHGTTTFAPSAYPFMFRWVHLPEGRSVRVRTPDELWALAKEQRIALRAPKYYLVPTKDPAAFASTFGLIPGLVALPASMALSLYDVEYALSPRGLAWASRFTAAVLCAASVALLYLCCLGLGLRRGRALLAAISFGFGTAVFSLSSQALWQQTASLFALSCALASAVMMQRHERGALRCGAALGLAILIRPTALLLAFAVGGFVLWERRRLALRFALPIAASVGLALLYNWAQFGSPFANGQSLASAAVAQARTGSPELFQTPLLAGAAGLLVSPGRGLLVYSPVCAFAVTCLRGTSGSERSLLLSLLVGLAAMWAVAFTWFDWWGGYCYAYRPLVDSMPVLALLLAVTLRSLPMRSAWGGLFALSLAWSTALHAIGAAAYEPIGWNEKDGQSIDHGEHRWRLWSWSDAPFLHYARNFSSSRALRKQLANQWISDPSM
jgi:hypothetical protein